MKHQNTTIIVHINSVALLVLGLIASWVLVTEINSVGHFSALEAGTSQ